MTTTPFNKQSSDLLVRTAELVNIESVSRNEKDITDFLEARLRAISRLEVVRVGNNLIARTDLGRAQRLLIGGHSDTVPVNDNLPAVVKDKGFGVWAQPT